MPLDGMRPIVVRHTLQSLLVLGAGIIGCSDAKGPTEPSRPILLNFTAITAGGFHTCGLAADGAAYCWGSGAYLGHGSAIDRSEPVPVAGGTRFVSLSAGSLHSCGVTAAGAYTRRGNDLTITTVSEPVPSEDLAFSVRRPSDRHASLSA